MNTKSITIEHHGDPSVLRLVRRPRERPGPKEVGVQVQFAGVNYADVLQRQGTYPVPVQLPHVPGGEIAGVVEDLGNEVTEVKVGDRVAALLDNGGGYSNYAIVPANRLVRLPADVGSVESTALLVQGLTAAGLLETASEPVDDKVVFVSAAAGGVGSLLVQMLKAARATVVAGIGSGRKEGIARELGADVVARYDREGWVDDVRRELGSRTVALAYDAVGGRVYRDAFSLLGPGATLIVYGASSGELVGVPPELFGPLIFQAQRVGGFALPSHLQRKGGSWLPQTLQRLFSQVVEGSLRVRVHPPFLLEQANEAHAAIESRMTTGKVVLQVEEG